MSDDRFLHTIPRTWVHRRAVSEVYVTHVGEVSEGSYVAAAQLPRRHFFYGDHSGVAADRYDPLLLMEAARQASMAIAHRYLGVPADSAFRVTTFNGTDTATTDSNVWQIDTGPADLTVASSVVREHRRNDIVTGVDMIHEFGLDGESVMTVDGSLSWVPPARWDAGRVAYRTSLGLNEFRGALPPSATATPASVGRGDARNVVLGPLMHSSGGVRAQLLPDLRHPALFDHPLDHVPGSLLIEAGRQLAIGALVTDGDEPKRIRSIRSSFCRFVELDVPAFCVATVDGASTVCCEVEQLGAIAARVEIEFG